MAPRPPRPGEPDFGVPDLSINTFWDRKTGLHGFSESEFITAFFGGTILADHTDFLFSEHDISNQGSAWIPQQVLGKGGFGVAGVWAKKNDDGETVDETVIKQVTELHDYQQICYKVAREASVNRDAQRQAHALHAANKDANTSPSRDHSIMHIRNYKFNQLSQYCRFYSIYAPHYTLLDLIYRYKCFNTLLPELFIWHIAYSLAKANKALSEPLDATSLFHRYPPPRQPLDYAKDCFILHMDLKPENVFLDYSPLENEEVDAMYERVLDETNLQDDPVDTYPQVKLADFGVAQYAKPGAANRSGDGTEGYLPPEQINVEHPKKNVVFGGWFHRRYRPNTDTEPFTQAHNTFAVGKVLYDCIMLADWNEIDNLMRLEKKDYPVDLYLANGNHFLKEDDFIESSPYSDVLLKVVRKCLSPKPADRPTPDELATMALAGLESARDQVRKGQINVPNFTGQTPGDASLYRLYYRGTEIHSMPLCDRNFPNEMAYYHTAKRRDVLGAALELPAQKWEDVLDVDLGRHPHGLASLIAPDFTLPLPAAPDFHKNLYRVPKELASDQIQGFVKKKQEKYNADVKAQRDAADAARKQASEARGQPPKNGTRSTNTNAMKQRPAANQQPQQQGEGQARQLLPRLPPEAFQQGPPLFQPQHQAFGQQLPDPRQMHGVPANHNAAAPLDLSPYAYGVRKKMGKVAMKDLLPMPNAYNAPHPGPQNVGMQGPQPQPGRKKSLPQDRQVAGNKAGVINISDDSQEEDASENRKA